MPSCNTYHLTWVSLTLGMGYLFTPAPAKRSRCSLPWTKGISLPLPFLTFNMGWLLMDHSHGKEMQKSKMAVWGGLTNSCEKKRSEKQRGKGKIYSFECRVPKKSMRDKKAFLNDQCKEIEENNRLGKTRDHFKKIRDTKGTFQSKMEGQKWYGPNRSRRY